MNQQIIPSRGPLAGQKISITDEFRLEVARGNVPGMRYVHKFGRLSNLSTTLSPICDGGFYRTPLSNATVTLVVVSTSTDDTADGDGAREVTVVYLDGSGIEQQQSIATNGQSESSETITNVFRVLRYWVSKSGTYATQSSASQKGDLTLRVSGGDVWATIPQISTGFGAGQSLIGAYTVPLGWTAYILSQDFSSDVSGTKTCDWYFFKRENVLETATPFTGAMRVQNLYEGTQGLEHFTHETYEEYPELTDIGFLAKASTTTKASCEFELLLIKN